MYPRKISAYDYKTICTRMFSASLFLITRKNPSSINRKMDKEIVVYSYKGILNTNRKEQMTHTCDSICGSQKNYIEPKKIGIHMTPVIGSLRTGRTN